MKIKQIVILALAGMISFSSAFTVSWFLKKKKEAALALQASQQQKLQPTAGTGQDTYNPRISAGFTIDRADSGLSERQLEHLIYDVRNKLKECSDRQTALETEAERIEISRQALQQDIDHFNELRDKLSTVLAAIQEQEESLQKSITEIDTIEKSNFQRLASTYDKMDSTQAGRILISMAGNNQLQDPVKILYYMNERMAGKLLSEIATAKPDLASLLSVKLKHVKETE